MQKRNLASAVLAGIVLTTTVGAGVANASPAVGTDTGNQSYFVEHEDKGAFQNTGNEQDPQGDAKTESETVNTAPGKTAKVNADDDEVNVVGVSWKGENPQPEIRSLKDGKWSSWEKLDKEDSGPDANTAEAQHANKENVSEAIPVTGADKIEVRSANKSADATSMKVKAVSTKVTEADENVAQGNVQPQSIESVTGQEPQAQNMSMNASAQAAQAQNTASTNVPGFGNIVTRAQWGANEKLVKCKASTTSTVKGIYLHHTSGSNSYTQAQAPGIIRSYLAFHTQDRGWCDIGYNFLVDKYGTVYEGRAGSINNAVVGAHASGFNTYTIGISTLGTYNSAAPSTAAQNSVKKLIAWKAKQYKFDPAGKMTLTSAGGSTSKYAAGKVVTLRAVSGHRDTSNTDCPGTAYYAIIPRLTTEAKKLMGSTPAPAPAYKTGGAIGTYYKAHTSLMGAPTSNENKLTGPNGAYQNFKNGKVYWSSKTGAHSVLNASNMVKNYQRVGWEKKFGFPTNDKYNFKNAAGSQGQQFEKGLLINSSTNGQSSLRGGIQSKWKAMGWERGPLSMPKAGDEKCGLTNGGCVQSFNNGAMYWSPKSSTHAVKGAVLKTYASAGYEKSKLGYPLNEEAKTNGTWKQNFQGGYITWNSAQGGKVVLNK